MEERWSAIVDKLGHEKFPEFLRAYWNSHHQKVRKSDLFKFIRRMIASKEDAFQLVRDLVKSADSYIALHTPYDEMWNGQPQVTSLLENLKLFQARQSFPLLLAAYESLSTTAFIQILKIIETVSFRYNIICGLNPNEQEKVYNSIALHIRTFKKFDVELFRPIYPDDNRFKAAFKNVDFTRNTKNHKLARYIFGSLEEHVYKNKLNAYDNTLTIEHILPEYPDAKWEAFDHLAHGRSLYRLANLTLLERSLNKAADVNDYEFKKLIFEKSKIHLTNSIPKHYEEWNEKSINSRQQQLAKHAAAVWRLEI